MRIDSVATIKSVLLGAEGREDAPKKIVKVKVEFEFVEAENVIRPLFGNDSMALNLFFQAMWTEDATGDPRVLWIDGIALDLELVRQAEVVFAGHYRDVAKRVHKIVIAPRANRGLRVAFEVVLENPESALVTVLHEHIGHELQVSLAPAQDDLFGESA